MSIDVAQGDTTLSSRVAEEIRATMGRKRVTGAELARRLGVSPMWVSYRLAGRQEIGLTDLERIASVLHVAPVELLPVDERMARQTNQRKFGVAVRPPDGRPKGRTDSVLANRRTRQKRALTAEELSIAAA